MKNTIKSVPEYEKPPCLTVVFIPVRLLILRFLADTRQVTSYNLPLNKIVVMWRTHWRRLWQTPSLSIRDMLMYQLGIFRNLSTQRLTFNWVTHSTKALKK